MVMVLDCDHVGLILQVGDMVFEAVMVRVALLVGDAVLVAVGVAVGLAVSVSVCVLVTDNVACMSGVAVAGPQVYFKKYICRLGSPPNSV